MKVMIVADAWEPQASSVVRTFARTRRELETMGYIVDMTTPLGLRTVSCPTYPEIRLSALPSKRVRKCIEKLAPQILYITTKGPLGLVTRAYVLRYKLPYTMAYHTCLSEYVQARFGIPLAWMYRFLRWFHSPAQTVMAPTPVVLKDLAGYGIINNTLRTRGVGPDIFTAQRNNVLNTAHPIFLYAGRVAVEKNVEAFLELNPPGSKQVVGRGPAFAGLKAKYPNVSYLGVFKQPGLVRVCASADVSVLPSHTDMFGPILLEVLASDLPVTAYPVTDPIDVLDGSPADALRKDLCEACLEAPRTDRATTRAHAEKFSWRTASEQFLAHLRPMPAASIGNATAVKPSTVVDA